MLPFLSKLETSIARVSQFAVRQLDLKKAFSLNHQIQRIIGFLEIPLRKNDFVGRRACS